MLAVAALCGATLPAQAPALSGRRHCRPIGWHASTAFCRVMMIQLLPGRTDIGQVFPTLVYQALVEPDGTE